MSNVNFIQSFNMFMEFSKRNKLTSHERMFYIALFHCANNLAMHAENYEWPDDYFPVSNSEMSMLTGFDERAIRNTKNQLKQKGLLDFKKGNGKKSDPEYQIYYMKRTGYKIGPARPAELQHQGTGNGPPKDTSDCENAPVHTKRKTIDCENAPDYAGDSVGDTVCGDVAIDCENAPVQPLYNINNIYTNTKQKRETKSNQIEPEEKNDGIRQDDAARIVDNYRTLIQQNIEYDSLLLTHKEDKEFIDGIVELILEIVLSGKKEIVIASDHLSMALVRNHLLKLKYNHIVYVIESFKANQTKVRNIKKYLLAVLFNAPTTIDGYYQAEVQHNMAAYEQEEEY